MEGEWGHRRQGARSVWEQHSESGEGWGLLGAQWPCGGLGNHCRGLSAHGEHQVKSHDVRHLGGQQRDFDPEKA